MQELYPLQPPPGFTDADRNALGWDPSDLLDREFLERVETSGEYFESRRDLVVNSRDLSNHSRDLSK